MGDNSKIEWTEATWNVVTGCTRISDGCTHCYIERTPPFRIERRRFDGPQLGATTGIRLHEDRLTMPLHWRRPRRIFVNSLADLFHDDVPDYYIAEVFAVMARAPQHTFQVLTKRHGRMRSLLNRPSFRDSLAHLAPWPLPNVWLGVSVESQEWADKRIPALLATPAAVRFLSCEPLLSPVDLRNLRAPNGALIDCLAGDVKAPEGWVYAACPSAIDWVIVGGESGPDARPMHPAWVRSLRDQCQESAAFHFKQWGEWGPAPFIVRVCDPAVGWQGTEEELAEAKRRSEAAGATHVHTGNWHMEDGQKVYFAPHEIGHKPWSLERVGLPEGMEPIRRWGKKAAGRELDGRTWDQFPEAVTADA